MPGNLLLQLVGPVFAQGSIGSGQECGQSQPQAAAHAVGGLPIHGGPSLLAVA